MNTLITRATGPVDEVPIGALKPYNKNARKHSKDQLRKISASITRFGFVNPVLVDCDMNVIAGHGRIIAAKDLGFDKIPVLRVEGLSDEERRAYILADNRLAELAGWDDDLLAIELGDLELDFDLDIIGFDTADIDRLLGHGESNQEDPPRQPDFEKPAITSVGDIWVLGDHRLICGDALAARTLSALMGKEKAQMVFTDPPYNVPIDGHVCGLGSVQHREFAMASGEMSELEFTGFLRSGFDNLAAFSADGSIHYICMDWRHMREILNAGDASYNELKNLVVWNKDNGGMGAFYRSKHELIFVFKKGKAAHINNFGLGEKGRYRTNVWDYAGINSMRAGRAEELAMHPTVKPVEMVADAILDCSKRGGIVLDIFGGSGTTLIAAQKTGRSARLVEIDPHYCDVIIRRWQEITGENAVNAGLDMTFGEMEG